MSGTRFDGAPVPVVADVVVQLRYVRQVLGLTQARIAYMLELPTCQIAYWEQGRRNPNPGNRARIRDLVRRLRRHYSIDGRFLREHRASAPDWCQTLRSRRQAAGLTQVKLGALAGLSQKAITLYECGHGKPSTWAMERIDAALASVNSAQPLTRWAATLRSRRLAAGLTQQALADLTPIARSTLSEFEAGRRIAPVDAMQRIDHVLASHTARSA